MTLQCPECRSRFTPRRSDQAFCSTACNRASTERELRRARRLYRALYHWRLAPRSKGKSGPAGVAANLRFICNEIASWIREDRESQRLPPPAHDHMADRGHQRPARPIRL